MTRTVPPTAKIVPPPLWKAAGEMRVLFNIGKSALSRRHPRQRGRGAPVLVVPGFGTSDVATVLLRDYLHAAGFDVHTWDLGINRGPRGDVMRKLSSRVRSIARKTRQRVRIVGWSLGGLMARVVAGRLPHHVGRVVALGSPLTADPQSSHLSRVYGWLGGSALQGRAVKSMLRDGARAPVTSIYSRNDGVVAWEASTGAPGACRILEVDATHIGLIVDRAVLELVSREVAREPVTSVAA
jgi:pimeloyl-ACP methyl ester carboxylesterase